MTFLGDEYLLTNTAAKTLFAAVRDLPLIDAHNHADVREICGNAPYTDLWQLEAATDHYVWSALRKCGVDESLITGPAGNREKWLAACAVWDQLAGSPTYEWVHLDLKRTLGIDLEINAENGPAIWDQATATLATDAMRPQALLDSMRVEVMCSTDDPIDTLEWHRQLAAETGGQRVRPTFRPDKAMNIHLPDWRDYIAALETRVNAKFASIDELLAGLRTTHDFFARHGCVASDHGVQVPYGYHTSRDDADAVFRKAMARQALTRAEEIAYMSYLLQEVAALDAEKGWVFQVHIGAVRNVREQIFTALGPDSGGDISSHALDIVTPLRDLLNRFDGQLKVVLYCLDPGHQPTITTLARAFGPTVRVGAAWWYNDAPTGMRRQLEYIGEVDLLSSFAGMVSDSRKLVSYASRHEMFRRVLCSVVGEMVARGRLPMRVAEQLVVNLSADNARRWFAF